MTADEFVDLCDQLGMTANDVARLFSTNIRTVGRWRSGEYDIPGSMRVALLLMAKHGETRESVADLLADDRAPRSP